MDVLFVVFTFWGVIFTGLGIVYISLIDKE